MNRIGFGFDSHRFAEGRPLMLAGVNVPYGRGLAGHSDGDAALHALIDAMYSAAGLPDIGEHFPDTDPQWAKAASADLATEALSELTEMGWVVANCDVTIVLEEPSLKEYKPVMRERVADLLGLDTSVVSIKAKTAEGMGLLGAGEG
ncbi:MAG: 2-C-methyl-D-erythritol 2,4-cyclodiphosphate synthase, partial [Planctomycetota bacterium]